jgi:hypothetical protein
MHLLSSGKTPEALFKPKSEQARRARFHVLQDLLIKRVELERVLYARLVSGRDFMFHKPALCQGMTSVVPKKPEKRGGFNP